MHQVGNCKQVEFDWPSVHNRCIIVIPKTSGKFSAGIDHFLTNQTFYSKKKIDEITQG